MRPEWVGYRRTVRALRKQQEDKDHIDALTAMVKRQIVLIELVELLAWEETRDERARLYDIQDAVKDASRDARALIRERKDGHS